MVLRVGNIQLAMYICTEVEIVFFQNENLSTYIAISHAVFIYDLVSLLNVSDSRDE